MNKTASRIQFPADHGNHMGSLTEWWYFNGHLVTDSGKSYSYGFCLFRATALVYFAHLSLTDEQTQQFVFERRFYPLFNVKFQKNTANISYDNEQVIEQSDQGKFRIKGKFKDIDLNLELEMEKRPLLINGNGKVNMPEGGESFYYSLTRLKTKGMVNREGVSLPVAGISWMDHQWGNFFVRDKGWDWFSLQLEDSTEYNMYSFRNSSGRLLKQYINTLDKENNSACYRAMKIARKMRWTNEVTANNYVTDWELVLPGSSDTFLVTATVKDQEIYAIKGRDYFPSYWEGGCTVTKKTSDGRIIKGRGFAEHFPYAKVPKEK
ncbi:MAG: lipocalin-like domain-containing protein [Bacteroidota bacterium]